MKKRNFGLCTIALFCMHNSAQAMETVQRKDNTTVVNHALATAIYKTNRPAVKNRLYISKAVEAEILRIKKLLTNPKLAWMFENCFPNTRPPCHVATRFRCPGMAVHTVGRQRP